MGKQGSQSHNEWQAFEVNGLVVGDREVAAAGSWAESTEVVEEVSTPRNQIECGKEARSTGQRETGGPAMHQARELGDCEHTLGWLPAHGETFCGNGSFPAINRVPETVCPHGVFWVHADSNGRGTINHARGVSAAAAGALWRK